MLRATTPDNVLPYDGTLDNRVSLGADPEVFVGSATKGYMPVCGMLGGTKDEPVAPFPDEHPDFTVQEDNVMAEFNVPPAYDRRSFVRNVTTGLSVVKAALSTKQRGLTVLGGCAIEFSDEALSSPQARTFGCIPDYDAYIGGGAAKAVAPDLLRVPNKQAQYRFAGGHIHIGWTSKPAIPEFAMAAFFDAYAYLPLLKYDQQQGRRQYYGTAGRYRPKPYGLEYRTPSNFWVHNVGIMEAIASSFFDVATSLNSLRPEYLLQVYTSVPWADVKRAIDTEDTRQARSLVAFLDNDLPIGIGS